MTINDKLSQLKKTIEEIKNISEKLGNHNVLESKIDKLNKEILNKKKLNKIKVKKNDKIEIVHFIGGG